MVLAEFIPLPFLWRFIPLEVNGTIVWRWRAASHSGDFVMESKDLFETLTECVEDARKSGYRDPAGNKSSPNLDVDR
jgi:hypothetical protein